MRLVIAISMILAQVHLYSCRTHHAVSLTHEGRISEDRYHKYSPKLAQIIPILNELKPSDSKLTKLKQLIPIYDELDTWGVNKKQMVEILPFKKKSKAVAYILAGAGDVVKSATDDDFELPLTSKEYNNERNEMSKEHEEDSFVSYSFDSSQFSDNNNEEIVSLEKSRRYLEQDMPVDGIGTEYYPKSSNILANEDNTHLKSQPDQYILGAHNTSHDKVIYHHIKKDTPISGPKLTKHKSVLVVVGEKTYNIDSEELRNLIFPTNIVQDPVLALRNVYSTKDIAEDTSSKESNLKVDSKDVTGKVFKFIRTSDVSDIGDFESGSILDVSDPQDFILNEFVTDLSLLKSGENSDVSYPEDLLVDDSIAETDDFNGGLDQYISVHIVSEDVNENSKPEPDTIDSTSEVSESEFSADIESSIEKISSELVITPQRRSYKIYESNDDASTGETESVKYTSDDSSSDISDDSNDNSAISDEGVDILDSSDENDNLDWSNTLDSETSYSQNASNDIANNSDNNSNLSDNNYFSSFDNDISVLSDNDNLILSNDDNSILSHNDDDNLIFSANDYYSLPHNENSILAHSSIIYDYLNPWSERDDDLYAAFTDPFWSEKDKDVYNDSSSSVNDNSSSDTSENSRNISDEYITDDNIVDLLSRYWVQSDVYKPAKAPLCQGRRNQKSYKLSFIFN